MPEALLSRFYPITCPQIERKNRQVIDYFGGRKSDEREAAKNQYIREQQIDQYLVVLVNKMQWAGVLCQTNMTIAHRTFYAVLKQMERQGVQVNAPRNYTRLCNTAKTLTILRALEIVFHTPTSSAYNKPFSLDVFPLLEPHLICTEEIAFFTLTLMSDQFVNKYEKQIVEALCKVAKYPLKTSDWNSDTFDKGAVSFKKDEATDVHDYNYVAIPGTLWDVATLCAGRMSKQHKHSRENIHASLKSMLERKLVTSKRTSFGPDGITAATDEFMLVTTNRTHVFVNVGFLVLMLDPKKTFSMVSCIRATFHRHTRSRRILLGETLISQDNPHLFQTMQTAPGADFMRVSNVDYQAGDDSEPTYIVDDDLEHVEMQNHLMSLYRKPEDFEHVFFEDVDNDAYSHTMDDGDRYPSRFLIETDYRKDTAKRLSGNISDADMEKYSIRNTRRKTFF